MNPLELGEEQRSAYLYRACADAENGTVRAELFRRLAGEAEAQAAIWRAQLTARGHPAPGPFVPDARTRIVADLVQWLGPRRAQERARRDESARHGGVRRDAARRARSRRAAVRCECSSTGIAASAAAATCAPPCSASTTGSCRTRA